MNDLLSGLKSMLTPDLVRRVGDFLGESPERASAGLGAAIPAVAAGVVRAGSSESGARDLIDKINQFGFNRSTGSEDFASQILRELTSGSSQSMTHGILAAIFGDKVAFLERAVGEVTGLGSQTVNRLLSFVAPLVLGFVGKKVSSSGMGPAALANYLSSQKDSVMAALPTVLGSSLGFTGMGDSVRRFSDHAAGAVGAGASRSSMPSWLIPALVAAALVLGGAWLFRRGRTVDNNKVPTMSGETTTPGASGTRTSPNDELNEYLDKGKPEDKPRAFRFENLTFEFGTASLSPAAIAIIDTMAQTLKDHPEVKIRIEGHTDGVGTPSANKELSMARAAAVRDALAQRGVEVDHYELAGMGDEQPVASNATEEGRAQNRRIEVIVLGAGEAAH